MCWRSDLNLITKLHLLYAQVMNERRKSNNPFWKSANAEEWTRQQLDAGRVCLPAEKQMV